MNNAIIAIIFGIVLISFVSAETIYAGDCLSVDLSKLESLDNVVYDVVGNKFNLTGLTIDLNKTTAIANICTVSNYKPDSFTIIFIDNSTKEVIKEVPVGGKSKTITEYVDNIITKWNNITRDEPIVCADDDSEKLNIGFYIWLAINCILIFWIIYVIVKLVQRNRIQNEVKENGKTNTSNTKIE